MAKIAVAPLVGARIEMYNDFTENAVLFVAPLVGARIEIAALSLAYRKTGSRSPRGSED